MGKKKNSSLSESFLTTCDTGGFQEICTRAKQVVEVKLNEMNIFS